MMDTSEAVKTPADVLDAAADLLKRDGWCQFFYSDFRHSHCAVGAIGAVSDWRILGSAQEVLKRHVGQMVTVWNDQKDQTAENVIRTMRQAAAEYRKTGK